MRQNIGKKPTEYTELRLERLQAIQSGLSKKDHSKIIVQNELFNVVEDVEECKLTYFKPVSDLPGIISELHASLDATFSRNESASSTADSHIIDRKFKSTRKGRGDKTCFICNKMGCRSTKHTLDEQLKTLKVISHSVLISQQHRMTRSSKTKKNVIQKIRKKLQPIYPH